MAPSLPFVLFLMFVIVPLIEIALLIRVGQWIGFWETIIVVVATAFIGTWLLRAQGFSVFNKFMRSVSDGKVPMEPIMEGMLLLIAGAFLLTPGLLTDATGFVLLVPPLRSAIAGWCLKRLWKAGNISVSGFGDTEDPSEGGGRRQGDAWSAGRDGDIIEGDYERVDERTVQPNDNTSNTKD